MFNVSSRTSPQSSDKLAQVSSGLNLWLDLADPSKMYELLLDLLRDQEVINAALTDLHYVHFARFLPTPSHDALLVITEFDGDLDAYVLDFVLAIGDQFDKILGYVKDHPPLPVKDHPAEFLAFVIKNNRGYGAAVGGRNDSDPTGGIGLYSAYPQRTVIDIVGASGMAPAAIEPDAVVVDRNDVQANVLRGVGMRHAWHAGFDFGAAAEARAFLAELLAGSNGAPQLSNASTRAGGAARPPYALTLGFSYEGLKALGISDADRAAFSAAHSAFVNGPDDPATAINNGDVGASQPAFWELGSNYPVHMLVSLFADAAPELVRQQDALLARSTAHGLSLVNRPWPAEALIDEETGRNLVHFGYTDGLSQPRLAISDEPVGEPDMQPRANVGEFLLGAAYPNVFGGKDTLGGLSPDLAQNATFAALRILEQDVAGFEKLLDEASAAHEVDREWLAAKMMGRWRDGTPLAQSADAPLALPGAPRRNQFDYLPSVDQPCTADDSAGLRCPIGAHVRRMNPRSARVAGRPHSRRLLRRGMPYGPSYMPGSANDGQKRGLIGMFLCADLKRQFEFIMGQWAQGDRATSGLAEQQDPIIGAQTELQEKHPISGQFRIPCSGATGDVVFKLPRLVKTVGSAYLFMPGLAGVGYLAGLGRALAMQPIQAVPALAALQTAGTAFALTGGAHPFTAAQPLAPAAPKAAPPDPNPATFDPRQKAFRDNPFDAYAKFRAASPMVKLVRMDSTWVFSHKHVELIAGDQTRFRKRWSADPASAGLLNMDPAAHTHCRAAVIPLFVGVLAQVAPTIPATVLKCYTDKCKNKGQARALDWMAEFAQPIASTVFLDVFGLKQSATNDVIKSIQSILSLASPAKDMAITEAIHKQTLALAAKLWSLSQQAPGRMFDLILKMPGETATTPFDGKSNKPYLFLSALTVERLANAVTLLLTGILPLQWFIALATWRLLDNGGMLLQQLKDEPAITDRQVIDELLRFDMSAPLSDRYVVADNTTVDGMTFNKDDRLTLAWSSANHDDAEFGPAADTINFKRNKGPGWAFGDAGEHNCLGRELVYLVMEPVIDTLRKADPTPRLELGYAPVWWSPKEYALFRSMVALMIHS